VKYEKTEVTGKYGVRMSAGCTNEKSTLVNRLPEMFWVLQSGVRLR
jgi:hypothetical protein